MTASRSTSLRRVALHWLAWLVGTTGVTWLNFHPTTAALDEDELYWIGSAHYFELAWVRGDWAHPDWQLLPARENPPVAKYVIGAGLAARGQRIESLDLLGTFYLLYRDIPGAWGAGPEYAKREAVVARMQPALREHIRPGVRLTLPAEIHQPARWVMLGCAVTASGLLLLLGGQLGSWTAGLLASQLLLLHTTVVVAYNHALSDAVAMLFSVAAAGMVMKFAARAEDARPWDWHTVTGLTAGTGVLLALACAAKMNALVVVTLFAGVALLSLVRRVRLGGIRATGPILLATGGTLAVALLVFVGINPAIWPDVGGGLVACVREHEITEGIQAQFLPGHLTTWPDKLSAATNQLGIGHVGLGLLGMVSLALLFAPGAAGRVVGCWWLIAAAAIIAWIPFERSRYVLPLVPPSLLAAGWLVAVALPTWGRGVWQRGPRAAA